MFIKKRTDKYEPFGMELIQLEGLPFISAPNAGGADLK